MKFFLMISTALFLQSGQCHKSTVAIPGCIQSKIDEIKAQPKWNPPAQVDEYNYQGKSVYLFTSNCCDQYIMLYDGSCHYVCAPSGGIDGGGDKKCKDFYTTAKHIQLIWKDPR
jgi:hypothetical protein